MKSLAQYGLGVVFLSIFALPSFPLLADTVIDTPGAHIYNGAMDTTVITPSTQIQVPPPKFTAPPSTPPQDVMNGAPMPTKTSSSYVNAQLTGMDFSNQNLAGADFTNATLTGANFENAILTHANFSNATLTGANLTNANLAGASLINATLSGANLSDAILSHANLTNATIDNALVINTHFDDAILANVDMSQVTRETPPRPAFTNAQAISSALKIDPTHPTAPHKIDLTVNFDFNSDKLTADGAKQVHEIASALMSAELQKSRILVEGHTDNVGADAYNKDLSYRRAMSVLHTLTNAYHIPGARLSAKGFGKANPIASNDSDLGRAMNRRVTLVNLGE